MNSLSCTVSSVEQDERSGGGGEVGTVEGHLDRAWRQGHLLPSRFSSHSSPSASPARHSSPCLDSSMLDTGGRSRRGKIMGQPGTTSHYGSSWSLLPAHLIPVRPFPASSPCLNLLPHSPSPCWALAPPLLLGLEDRRRKRDP